VFIKISRQKYPHHLFIFLLPSPLSIAIPQPGFGASDLSILPRARVPLDASGFRVSTNEILTIKLDQPPSSRTDLAKLSFHRLSCFPRPDGKDSDTAPWRRTDWRGAASGRWRGAGVEQR